MKTSKFTLFLLILCITLLNEIQLNAQAVTVSAQISFPDGQFGHMCEDKYELLHTAQLIASSATTHFYILNYDASRLIYNREESQNSTWTITEGPLIVDGVVSPTYMQIKVENTLPETTSSQPYSDIYNFYFKPTTFTDPSSFPHMNSHQSLDDGASDPYTLEFTGGFLPADLLEADVIEPNDNLLSNQSFYPPGTGQYNDEIYIKENFILDEDFNMTGNSNPNVVTRIFVAPGAKIEVSSGKDFIMKNYTIETCEDEMWTGIHLNDQSSLELENNVIVNADYAIDGTGNLTLNIKDNTFDNNHHAMRLEGNRSDILDIQTFIGNTFDNSSTLLPRPNGLPTPSSSPSHVDIKDYPNVNLAAPLASTDNIFQNADIGIDGEGSNVLVHGNQFIDLGVGIRLTGTANASVVDDNTFTNIADGVYVTTHSINSENNTFTNVDEGYFLLGTGSRFVNIRYNDLNVNDKGITSFYNQSGLFLDNTVTFAADNTEGIGIDLLLTDYATIRENTFDLQGIHAGIFLNSCGKGIVKENTVLMKNSTSGTRGIDLMDATKLIASCNLVEGDTPSGFTESTGIFAENTPHSTFACNEFDKIEDGMRFIGNNMNDKLRGNSFREHLGALTLGDQDFDTETVIGVQDHYGNEWLGSQTYGAKHFAEEVVILNLSKFEYDSNENTDFDPGTVISNGSWFEDILDPNPSFYCLGSAYECDGSPGSNLSQEVPSDDYVEWINYQLDTTTTVRTEEKWVWKNQLYDILINYVDPSDYTPAINAYLNNTAHATQEAFADVQTEINTAFEENTTLQSLTNQITDNLNLYNTTQNDIHLTNNISLISQLDTESQSNDTHIITHLSNAETLLDNITIPTGDQVATYYADVYYILFNFIKTGYTLTTSEEADLIAIANECPALYGKAVSIARAILRHKDSTIYGNFTNCPISIPREIESKNSNSTSIFPNPASNEIRLSRMISSYTISDMQGRIVMQSKNKTNNIDISSLQTGLYIIHPGSNENTPIKFIKL